MKESVPTVHFWISGLDGAEIVRLPRRLIIIHLDRYHDRDWIAATYAQRRGGTIERLEGLVARRDLLGTP